ncbi:phosphoribosyltransferase [Pleurocapsales cyanobacterium LEGE 10410]|nr:phosphoribosyltransferase [Pleurocapsales cyanobacterium LEGE 10410]
MLFQNRTDAGAKLASNLSDYANRSDVVVVGLPRGGVPVAFIVAEELNLSFNILMVRKLGMPGNRELAIGAIASGGIQLFNKFAQQKDLSPKLIKQIVLQEQQELERRERIYLNNDRSLLDVESQTVIIVDDGLATGTTMLAAIEALQQQQPKQIVVAVPIGSKKTCEQLAQRVDRVVCLEHPEPFKAVGNWYQSFPQLSDREVCFWLTEASEKRTKPSRYLR